MNAVLIEFSCAYQVDYCLLLKVKLPPLPDVICLLPWFSHCIYTFKGKTSDVVILEQILDTFRLLLYAL